MIAGGSGKTLLLFVSVGGTNGHDFFSDVHRFNFREGTWTKCHVTGFSRGPEARYRHELAYWQSKVVNRTLQTHKEYVSRYVFLLLQIFMLGGGTSMEVFGFTRYLVSHTLVISNPRICKQNSKISMIH